MNLVEEITKDGEDDTQHTDEVKLNGEEEEAGLPKDVETQPKKKPEKGKLQLNLNLSKVVDSHSNAQQATPR
jgi:hypothetical protein